MYIHYIKKAVFIKKSPTSIRVIKGKITKRLPEGN